VAVHESEQRIRRLVVEMRKLASAVRDSPERRRRLFLLLGASYALIRGDRLGYKAEDATRFSEPAGSRDEFEDVAQDLVIEKSVTLGAEAGGAEIPVTQLKRLPTTLERVFGRAV
jgi:hypothetical protein